MVDFKKVSLALAIERAKQARYRPVEGRDPDDWSDWETLTPGMKQRALTRIHGQRDDATISVDTANIAAKTFRVTLLDIVQGEPEITEREYQFR